jgi:carbonic anhydrase
VIQKARDRGVPDAVLATLRHAGIDMQQWLRGFDNVQDGVKESVEMIRNHPLLPRDIPVHGMIIHPETGKLDLLSDGYQAALT